MDSRINLLGERYPSVNSENNRNTQRNLDESLVYQDLQFVETDSKFLKRNMSTSKSRPKMPLAKKTSYHHKLGTIFKEGKRQFTEDPGPRSTHLHQF